MDELLESWGLETDWEMIQQKSRLEWKRLVAAAAEKVNVTKLRDECEIKCRGEKTKKTKTAFVLESLDSPNYQRVPDPFILRYNYILYTRALIMGRFGMLKCASNFHNGFGSKICNECKVKDDENHRINNCVKWQGTNRYGKMDKIVYNDIYSNDTEKCFEVIRIILSLWDLESGKNEMRLIV